MSIQQNNNKIGLFSSEIPSLKDLKTHFKGKGGGPESESHVLDSNMDKKDGYVYVYSDKADVAKIIDRCEKSIISYSFLGSGVQFKIKREAFRGIHCAFRNVK
jgi:alpha-mannosidase